MSEHHAGHTAARARMIGRDDAGRTLWEHRGEVYVAATAPVWASAGSPLPMNVRWECSVAHLARYWDTVFAPAGWVHASAAEVGS